MLARCTQCGLRFVVPDERARNPGLRARCRCGAEFPLHAGRPQAAAAAPAPPPTADAAPSATPAPAAVDPKAAAPSTAALRAGAWRRCANHPQVKSESMCPACGVGYCRECERRVNNVPVCPRCEGLCSDVLKVEEDQAREKQRARTMKDDIGFIAVYPFTDRAAFIMLAVFTWFFSFFSGFPMGVILSKGVLVWYSFTALTKVSIGKFRGYMPNFGDITDIVHPMRLSLAAFLAASWPLIVLPFVVGPPELPSFIQSGDARDATVHAQEVPEPVSESEGAEDAGDGEAGEGAQGAEQEAAAAAAARRAEEDEGFAEPRQPPWVLPLYGLAFLWQLLYMPMALIVAAISRGFFKTLNPIIGVEAIGKMGSAYWFAAGLYTVLTTLQVFLDRLLGIVPIAGSLVASFLAAYVALTTGCALGLAVFKKAKELNLD